MLKDLEQLKKQLAELAEVINSFKSEAVQLKIIEFIFKGGGSEAPALPGNIDTDAGKRNRRRKKRSSPRELRGTSTEKHKTRRGRSGSGKGAWPAPGSEDTELGVLMEPEVGHGKTEVYPRVQA
jgi:hypothetical protein